MENISEQDFLEKFRKLTPQNQRYLVCIQEALSFTQQIPPQEECKKEDDRDK